MAEKSGSALLTDREQVAERLLEASAKHSYDPDTELDWDAPLEPGKWFLPERMVSLYGTPIWNRLSEQRRIELSRHEAASLASAGVWFEVILMQLLARHIYDMDPRSRHVTYALTEMADECRHSRMFARMVTKLDTPYYGPGGIKAHPNRRRGCQEANGKDYPPRRRQSPGPPLGGRAPER